MRAECIRDQLEFHPLGSRDVGGRFDGGRQSSTPSPAAQAHRAKPKP